MSSVTDLDPLQSSTSTVHTAMHCRSFRDDDILKCLEQFCGLHVHEPATTRATLPKVALVWRNWRVQSCQFSALFCCPSVESSPCLASYYLHNDVFIAFSSSLRVLPRSIAG